MIVKETMLSGDEGKGEHNDGDWYKNERPIEDSYRGQTGTKIPTRFSSFARETNIASFTQVARALYTTHASSLGNSREL